MRYVPLSICGCPLFDACRHNISAGITDHLRQVCLALDNKSPFSTEEKCNRPTTKHRLGKRKTVSHRDKEKERGYKKEESEKDALLRVKAYNLISQTL